jgi:hypothetical protein
MIDDFAKEYLHSDLREIREVILWKLGGLSEYDVRRPLTSTGTNLLGLVKHQSLSESRYFGEVFDRPFPEPLPRWDDAEERDSDMWATENETREEITETSRHAGHADILREQLDGSTGTAADARPHRDEAFWAARRAEIEGAAKAAGTKLDDGP